MKNNLLYRNVGCTGSAVQTSIGNPGAVLLQANAILTSPPPFVGEAGRDLRLAPGGPLVDTGVLLTGAAASGSGTQLRVEDAAWFFDGYGMPGEVGDAVQLEGQTATARSVAIDYASHTLYLSQPLTCAAGQGLTLLRIGLC